jgi:hypothetical protein
MGLVLPAWRPAASVRCASPPRPHKTDPIEIYRGDMIIFVFHPSVPPHLLLPTGSQNTADSHLQNFEANVPRHWGPKLLRGLVWPLFYIQNTNSQTSALYLFYTLHLLLRWLLRNSYCEVEAALFPRLFRSFLTTSFAPWVVIHTNIRTCTFTSIHVYILYMYQMENPFLITSLSPVDDLCVRSSDLIQT